MWRSNLKLFCSGVAVLLVCCGLSPEHTEAAVFRDRVAFTAASQNLRTIDFQSAPFFEGVLAIDGVFFSSLGGSSIVTEQNGNKVFMGNSVGEITRITVLLPPGTTAVGCEQFNTPMILSISTGESVTMNASDNSTFAGFVSEQPIESLTISLDFPEPTPAALIDNLSFGQRRAGNEPPVPQLLLTSNTGRALALDSVTAESEPFHVLSSHNFSTDGHSRITLFIVGVALEAGDVPFVTVQAEDSQQRLFNLPVEATARVRNLSWMSQVTVRVDDSFAGAGNLNVAVTVRGKVSNKGPLRIE